MISKISQITMLAGSVGWNLCDSNSNLWNIVHATHVKWIFQGKGREIVELLRQPETSMAIADNIAIMKGMPPQTLFVCVLLPCRKSDRMW